MFQSAALLLSLAFAVHTDPPITVPAESNRSSNSAIPAPGTDQAPRLISSLKAKSQSTAGNVLSEGRFFWLSFEGYSGPVTWDLSGDDCVTIFTLNAKDYPKGFPGLHEGDTVAQENKLPVGTADVYAVFFKGEGIATLTAWGIRAEKPAKIGVQTVNCGAVDDKRPKSFAKLLQTAFDAATDDDKHVTATRLADLYRSAAKITVKDPKVLTYGTLFDDMKSVSTSQGLPSKIIGVHKVIGDRLNASIGTDRTKAIDRTLAANEFNAIATALEALK